MPTKAEVEAYFKQHDHPNYVHSVDEGKKYFRVLQGSSATDIGRSVKLFIDKATGKTWGSASAKAPNKRQAYGDFRDAVPDPVHPYRMRYRSQVSPERDRQNIERALAESKEYLAKWTAEQNPTGAELSAAQAAHYEKKLAELAPKAPPAAPLISNIPSSGLTNHKADQAAKAEEDAQIAGPAPTRGAVIGASKNQDMKTQSGWDVDTSHFRDSQGKRAPSGDWQNLSRQDHADMVVGLESKLEDLHEEADHLDKVGLSSLSTRDEIAEHEAAIAAHHDAAYGKAATAATTQLPLPMPAPGAHPATIAVATQLAPRDQKIVQFAQASGPKDVRATTREGKLAAFASESRAPKEAAKALQTGLRGGQFYTTASGAKVYVK